MINLSISCNISSLYKNDMRIDNLFNGEIYKIPPVWIMRQAGRYLKEYKSIRKNFPNFMDMCLDVDAMVEVTLLPIKKFDFDAAIIFSDILIIPHALGQNVRFSPSPILDPLIDEAVLCDSFFDPLCKAIKEVRNNLDASKSLIGFAGAPLTLLKYMGCEKTKLSFIEDCVIRLLLRQIESGCNIIHIFDSHASLYSDEILISSITQVINKIRSKYTEIPIIYFAKGANHIYQKLNNITKRLGFAIDQTYSLELARKQLGNDTVLQGNICPISLENGTFEVSLKNALKCMEKTPYICGLGHGILKDTPVANVYKFLEIVRENN